MEDPTTLGAVLCVATGPAFSTGTALGPGEPDVARREGWIWVEDRARHHPATLTTFAPTPPPAPAGMMGRDAAAAASR